MSSKSKELELSIKIAGKIDRSLTTAINGTKSNISGLSRTLSTIGSAGLAAMSKLAIGTVSAIAECTSVASQFEQNMSAVTKYVSGLADESGRVSNNIWDAAQGGNGQTYAENYREMEDAILSLSTQIPYTAEDLTRLAAAAGQSGKSLSDLIQIDAKSGQVSGFLRDVAMMGTAWDISADQAGDWAAKWEVAFGKTHGQIMELADQINYLGAHNATTAAEIAQAVNDAAGLGQVAGMDVDATAALATSMLAMGVEGSKAANSINRIYTNMSKGESATKKQIEMWQELGFSATGIAKSLQEDASGTILDVFTAIQNLPEERQVAALSTLFGQWAITGAAKLTGNLDTFRNALAAVNDPSAYNGSMQREFVIQSETSAALDTRMASAYEAFQIHIGDAFLPAKKELDIAIIDFLNQLSSMPELGQVAEMLASAFGSGIQMVGDALEKSMPVIEKALSFLAENGPQVADALGKIALAFLTMKFAPAIEGAFRGVGGLLFGTAAAAPAAAAVGGGTAAAGGLLSGGLLGLGHTAGAATLGLGTAAVGTAGRVAGGVGRYATGVGSALKNFGAMSGLTFGLQAAGGTGLEILRNIASAEGTGLARDIGLGQGTGLANLPGILKGGALLAGGKIVSGASKAAGFVANSAPGQFVAGALHSKPAQLLGKGAVGVAHGIRNSIPAVGAGAKMIGSIWAPFATGFGSLLATTAPAITAISGVIAIVSILGDHLENISPLIENVFGEKGVAVFDAFTGKLKQIGTFISDLFQDGGVAKALDPLQNLITGNFGEGAGAAFSGLVQILQSVMSIVGQIVTFAIGTVKPIIIDIFSFLTSTVIPVILEGFTAAAPIIASILSNLGTAIMTAMTTVGTVIRAVLPIIEGVFTGLLAATSVAIPAVLGFFNGFAEGVSNVVSGVKTFLEGIITFITGVFTLNAEKALKGFGNIFVGAWETVLNLVKAPINAIKNLMSGIIDRIKSIISTVGDLISAGDKTKTASSKSASNSNAKSLPQYAAGGFTNGPVIAGEAGTEAVISFQRSQRAANIATWVQAGQMLGVGASLASLPASSITGSLAAPTLDAAATLPALSAPSVQLPDLDISGGGLASGGGDTITIHYAPVINGGNRSEIESILRADKDRLFAQLDRWYEQRRRDDRRVRY